MHWNKTGKEKPAQTTAKAGQDTKAAPKENAKPTPKKKEFTIDFDGLNERINFPLIKPTGQKFVIGPGLNRSFQHKATPENTDYRTGL